MNEIERTIDRREHLDDILDMLLGGVISTDDAIERIEELYAESYGKPKRSVPPPLAAQPLQDVFNEERRLER